MNAVYRIVSGAAITPREIRWAGIFALVWFAIDVFWFLCTWFRWLGF